MVEVTGGGTTLRTMSAALGILSRPDGSCDYSQGLTTVVSAVYGPTEVRLNRELIDRASVEASYRPKAGVPTCRDKLRQSIVEKTCESLVVSTLHPRTAVNVAVQVVDDDGSELACCLNAANLALMDAGVPTKYQIAAVTVAATTPPGELIVDPIGRVERSADAVMTFAFESRRRDVVTVSTSGPVSTEVYSKAVALAREASDAIFEFYRARLSEKIMRAVTL